METIYKKYIIALINSALNCNQTDCNINVNDEDEIKQLYLIAKSHNIINLIYYGFYNLGLNKCHNVKKFFYVEAIKNIKALENQLHYANKIFEKFNKNNIDFMPLKGLVLKDLYPQSNMRYMCDLDILIKKAQYGKIKNIMKDLGFIEILESDHELIWKTKDNVSIELHKCLIPSYNNDFYKYFGDGWQFCKINGKNTTQYFLSNEDTFIFIFAHFAKHYRDGGIGIKHLCDLYLLLKHNLDENYIMTQLRLLNLDVFYTHILEVINAWFNNCVPTEHALFISDYIFNSGAYGTYNMHIKSIAATQKSEKEKLYNIKTFLKICFLSFSKMKKEYIILNKFPFLLPSLWIYRAFHVLLIEPNKAKRQIKNVKIVSQKNIEQYKKDLNYVGINLDSKKAKREV